MGRKRFALYTIWSLHLQAPGPLIAVGKLVSERELPKDVIKLIELFPKSANPMAALRTGTSLLSFSDPEADGKSMESNVRKTIRPIARVPSIIAYFDRVRRHEPLVHPKLDPAHNTAANNRPICVPRRLAIGRYCHSFTWNSG